MAGACTGLRVVEIARGMPGTLAGMVLADHGADVVRIESPAGDPYLSQAGDRLWNRGKTRIALDLDDVAQRSQALVLVRAADVVIVGVPPTTAERWGIAPGSFSTDNPGLIFSSISGFGWNGPARDQHVTEALMYAISGGMMMQGNGGLRDGPIFVAPHSAAYAAALLTVQGILAALRERDGSGVGQHVDVGLYQGMLAYRSFYMWDPELRQEDFPSLPATTDPRGVRPLFNLNECSDGRWLSMGAWTPALTYKALEVMGRVDLLADPRFAGMPNVIPDDASRRELLEILWAEFRQKPLQYWLDAMDAQGIPCEPVYSFDEFRELGQLWANDYAVRVDDPAVGPMVQQGVLGELSETPGEIRPAQAEAAPASAVRDIAARWQSAPTVRGSGSMRPGGRGPLAGVRVLDLTLFLSGPMATHLLCDMGADVVKAESPEGDDFRISAPSVFRYLHRDKQCVVLDLKTPEGQAGLEQLVRESDVVVYNYRLGVEDRLGLGYERLRAINPQLIVCRVTAFGARGDRAHRGGYDASITALSGINMFQAGESNQPVSIGMADISTGIAAATALSLAIRAKETTGLGQSVEVAMIGAMAYVDADAFTDYAGKPRGEVLDRGQHGFHTLYRLYQTSDGWLLLSARPSQGPAVCAALGLGTDTAADDPTLEAAFARQTTAAAIAALKTADVDAANPLVDAKTFLHTTPSLKENRAVIVLPHPVYGNLGQTGPAVHFSRTPVRIERQESVIGEHNDLVLRKAASTPG